MSELMRKADEASQKLTSMRYALGLQEVKTASANVALQETVQKGQTYVVEMQDLRRAKEAAEQQLKDTVSSENFKREMQAVRFEKECLLEENMALRIQVKSLEEEVKDTKDRFSAYQAKIRAATM
jgi:hypothetical protein